MRKLLNKVLKSDSDLEAFCLDYFPQVSGRFSTGMDRIQKTNILLQQSDLELIVDALRQHDPSAFESVELAAPLASGEPDSRAVVEAVDDESAVPSSRPIPGLSIADIFRTAGQPEHTFVEPAQAIELKLRLRTVGEGLLVEGPSGVGKTTAVEKALQELGQRPHTVWLSALSERDRSSLDGLIQTDFQQGGHLVVDDFHHLDRARQAKLTSLIKVLSDRNRRDAKVTLIGINPASHSLLSYYPDAFGRFAVVRMNKQPDTKVDELIRKGEDVANIVFERRDEFVTAARGSFVIAQRLCLEAAILAGIIDAKETTQTIADGPEQAIRKVHKDLDAKFRGLLSSFAAFDGNPPPRGACLLLLYHLSRSEDACVSLDEVRYREALLEDAFSWLMASNLNGFFETNPAMTRLLYYNRDGAVLSAEDPQLEFYLRQLDWPAFARATGHAQLSWDPQDGPVFRPRAEPVPPQPSAAPAAPAPAQAAREKALETKTSWVLHLSDLHLGASETATTWYNQLAADLKYELSRDRLDAVIVSGDIANHAEPEEYQAAQRFFQELMSEFGLTPQKMVLVPGNHDLNWTLSEKAYTPARRKSYKGALTPGMYIDGGDYIELRAEKDYQERFRPFANFYQSLRLEPYPLDYAEQATVHHLPDQNLLVLGLNSAWALDHHFKERVGIHAEALSRALQQIRNTPAYAPCLKLAVWHHALSGEGQDRIKDTGFLEQLAQAGFRFGLHGHIHKAENTNFRYYRQAGGGGIELLGAGTFGAPTREWVPGYPLQYQLLEIGTSTLTVHTRRREEINGAWKPDARWLTGPGKDPRPRYEFPL